MSEPNYILQPIRRKWWRPTRGIAIGLIVVVTLVVTTVVAISFWKRLQYPYGWSHCCDIQLYFALEDYARTHDGWYPAGEETPEASLSLLHIANGLAFDCAHLLAGKRLAEKDVQAVLDRGKRLGPDSCGWNYVEGLRSGDDARLALFWDKEGLHHNGGRLAGGGHIVVFMYCHREQIPAKDWSKFLRQQEALWDNLRDQARVIRMSEAGRTPAGGKS